MDGKYMNKLIMAILVAGSVASNHASGWSSSDHLSYAKALLETIERDLDESESGGQP